MPQDYNSRKSISQQFPYIRPDDQSNVKTVVDMLMKVGLQVQLAGSALERADYNDIDLGAWNRKRGDARPLVGPLLEQLGVTSSEKIIIPATYVHGWFRFEYQGTRFDLVCASHKYYLGYL